MTCALENYKLNKDEVTEIISIRKKIMYIKRHITNPKDVICVFYSASNESSGLLY